MTSDAKYYRIRESQERALSEVAVDPAVRQIYRELAERYRDLSIGSQRELWPNVNFFDHRKELRMRIHSLFVVSAAVIVAITPVAAQSTGAMSGRQSNPTPASTSPNGATSGTGADNGMMSDSMESPSTKGMMAGTKPMAKKSMHRKQMAAKKTTSAGMTPHDR